MWKREGGGINNYDIKKTRERERESREKFQKKLQMYTQSVHFFVHIFKINTKVSNTF